MKKKSLSLLSLLLAALLAGPAFASVEQVDINTADAATLDRVLTGIGPSKAEAIVAHRTQHGAFRSIEELVEVKGIGLATIEQNRDRILVGESSAGPAPAAPAPAETAAAPAPQPARQ